MGSSVSMALFTTTQTSHSRLTGNGVGQIARPVIRVRRDEQPAKALGLNFRPALVSPWMTYSANSGMGACVQ